MGFLADSYGPQGHRENCVRNRLWIIRVEVPTNGTQEQPVDIPAHYAADPGPPTLRGSIYRRYSGAFQDRGGAFQASGTGV